MDRGRSCLATKPLWKLRYSPRSTNTIAHNFARWAACDSFTGYLLLLPFLIPYEVLCDNEGTSSVLSSVDVVSVNENIRTFSEKKLINFYY